MSSFCSTGCLGHGDDESCEHGFRHHGDGIYECTDGVEWCTCKRCSWVNMGILSREDNYDDYDSFFYAGEINDINNYMNTGKMASYLYDEDAIWEAYDAMRRDDEDSGEPNFLTKENVEKRAERRRIKKNRNKKFFKLAQFNLDFKNPNTYPVHQLEHKYFVKPSYKGYTKTKFFNAPRRVKMYEIVSPEAPRNNAMSEILHSFKNEKTKADSILMDFSAECTMNRCKRELGENKSDEIKDELSYFDLFPDSIYTTDSYENFFDDDWCGDFDEECRLSRESDMTPLPDDENDYSYSYEYDDWI